ncbi:MAG TPA: FAD-binding oxidoreductase, partial [Pirellulaceae bacterium]
MEPWEGAGMAYLGSFICVLTAAWLLLCVLRGGQRALAERRWQTLRIAMMREELALIRRQAARAPGTDAAWEGVRKFRVARKVEECHACHSFYLEPHDGKPLPPFRPGQYLTFQLRVPGHTQPLHRCYSLSDAPRENMYRCTIRQVPGDPNRPDSAAGRASTFFNQVVQEGDLLDVKAPRGTFALDLMNPRPIVLLGAGIGVTPLLSMLNASVEATPEREVFFFLGVRNSREHPFKRHLEAVASRCPQVVLDVSYSAALESDRQGTDYQ